MCLYPREHTWGLDSDVGADEHVGLKQRLREGDHQGLKQPEGRGIGLLHDLAVHVHVWQGHALPQPAGGQVDRWTGGGWGGGDTVNKQSPSTINANDKLSLEKPTITF